MSVSIDFRNRICKLVDESDYTRSEFRAAIKLSSSTMTNALVYGIIPTPKSLIKLADFFNVSLDYLLGNTEKNEFLPSTKNKTFYERLDDLVKENDTSYYKIGLACGFDKCIVYRWKKKGFLPSYETLVLLCKYFNVSPDYLLGRSDFRARSKVCFCRKNTLFVEKATGSARLFAYRRK